MSKWSVIHAKYIKNVCTTHELNNVERATRTIKSFTNNKIIHNMFIVVKYIYIYIHK